MAPKPGTSIAYAYASDPETGAQLPRRLARRLTRRAKAFISIGVLVALFLLVSDTPAKRFTAVRQSTAHGVEDIWSDDQEVEDGGWSWSPFRPGRKPSKTVPTDKSSTHSNAQSYIAPLHPDLSLLPGPEELFPEVSIPRSLRSPERNPFPDTRLREIIDPNPPGDSNGVLDWALGQSSFNQQWEPPEHWDGPRGTIKPVQWSGFAGPRDGWESDEEQKTREHRRDAVKRGFVYAWQGYKDHAWGE